MDIHFCDLCNESVPQSDLDQGRAFVRKGRVVCALCDAAMHRKDKAEPGVAMPGPGGAPVRTVRLTEPRRGLGMEWAAAVGALGLVGLGWLALERIEKAQGDAFAEFSEQARRVELAVDGLERRVLEERERSERAIAALEEAVQARMALLESEREAGAALRSTELTGIERGITALERELVALGQERTALTQRFESLAEDQSAMRGDLSVVAQALLDSLAGGGLEGRAETPPVEPLPGAELQDAPDWLQRVAGLGAADASTRWDTVESLGETGDPRVASFLVPALGDEDLFVRMAAARVLGELGNSEAIPGLIDALGDAEPSVREAAVLSLRTLSGMEFGFRPGDAPGQREKRVEAWREWWERSGSQEAESGAP